MGSVESGGRPLRSLPGNEGCGSGGSTESGGSGGRMGTTAGQATNVHGAGGTGQTPRAMRLYTVEGGNWSSPRGVEFTLSHGKRAAHTPSASAMEAHTDAASMRSDADHSVDDAAPL